MSLFSTPHHVAESEVRRVLAAIQLTENGTGLPLNIPARIVARSASIAQAAGQPLQARADLVAVRQNHRGLFVISQAPFFDQYIETFDPPPGPPETAQNPLRIRFDIIPQSTKYLARSVVINLPRSNDPTSSNAAVRPITVPLFFSPSIPSRETSTTIRFSVSRSNSPVPGVLVSIFRSPRQGGDQPFASGMTDWKSPLAGEAIVELRNIPRFRPGAGSNIIETSQAIEIEAIRDTAFVPATSPLPDPDRLALASEPTIQRVSWTQIEPNFTINPPTNPVSIQAGRQYDARFTLP